MKTLALCLCLTGCAHTSFYRDGRPVARFEGDMTGMRFVSHADGSFEWSGDINHSAATKAQQEGAASNIAAIGTGLVGIGVGTMIH